MPGTSMKYICLQNQPQQDADIESQEVGGRFEGALGRISMEYVPFVQALEYLLHVAF